MRKIYTLALTLFGAFAFAQTPMNTNGSLEDWTDGTAPALGWFMQANALNNGIVTKIVDDAQDGVISVKLQAKSGNSGNNQVGLQDIEVVGGQQYVISYWYKTTDEVINFKHWGQWRTATSAIQVSQDPFQPSASVEYAGEWTNVTVTSTAPEDASILRLTFRNYTNSSDVYIDNVVVSENTVSVGNHSLNNLLIYPNPVTGSQFYVESDSSSMKSVTIFDVLGKQVLFTTTTSTVNVAGLQKGVYIVKVSQDGKIVSKKLVIK